MTEEEARGAASDAGGVFSNSDSVIGGISLCVAIVLTSSLRLCDLTLLMNALLAAS
ncbi:MAG TPA: hypothetical protein VK720_16925 [Terracidiphilus sp.]|jgi:hypothetical protein|nr:hypothetical protein [Terracidiphilus sp.]